MPRKQFELRFEGPKDSSANTLRQIKGVFVADLEFPITDVQRFIEHAPVTIKQADSEAELQHAHGLLERAGAKVLIISDPANSDITNLELEPLELEFEKVLNHSPTELVNNAETEPLELSFEFKTQTPAADDTLDLSSNLEFTNELEIKEFEAYEPVLTTDKAEYDLSFTTDLSLDINDSDTLESNKNESISLTSELEKSEPAASALIAENSQDKPELELFMPAGSTLLGNEDSGVKTGVTEPEQVTSPQTDIEQVFEVPTPAIENNYRQESCASKNEEIIELTLEQLKNLQAPQKKRKSSLSLILITLICSAVLVYINSTIFNGPSKSNPFDSLIASLPQPAIEEQQAQTKAATENVTSSWYSSQNVFSDRNYKASIWVENKIPVHASIEVSSPKPAALTKEEIINNTPERAWLKRIDIKDLIFKKENDLFSASGPALAYFQIAEKNQRITGQAQLIARIDSVTGNINLEVKAYSNNLESTQSEPDKGALNLMFGLNPEAASGKDYFSYTENILFKKP